MTLQDLHTALQDHAVMLYVVGAVTACCCVLDLVRATVMPDQWQSLGDRTRRFGLRVLYAGANRRPPHVLPADQPDIPMPDLNHRSLRAAEAYLSQTGPGRRVRF